MLNDQQLKALKEVDKPLILVAGPGTGKTTVIAEKINYLINEKKVSAEEILALTFTDKAANEMSTRVESSYNVSFNAKTFHSFALELIEELYSKIPNIDKNFILIDEANILLYFYENINNFKFSSVKIGNNYSNIASELKSTILKLKDFGISLKNLDKLEFSDIQTKIDIITIFSKYEQYKKDNNYLDFSDLLLSIRDLLSENSEVLSEIKSRYKYILVDEFQDTNKLQLEILNLLSDSNITVVGDQKQSIYSFRGSNYENWNLFKEYFKNYSIIYLNENYRSSISIINTVNKLTLDLADKKEILDGNVNEEGVSELIECEDEFSQADFIVSRILELKESNPDKRIGILARRKSELNHISKELDNNKIKYSMSQSEDIFDNEVLKTIFNSLAVIINPKQSNQELFHLLNETELRKQTIKNISRKSSFKEKSIYNVLKTEENFSDFMSERKVVRDFFNDVEHLISLKESKTSIVDIIKEIIIRLKLYQKAEFSKNFKSISSLNNFIKFTQNFQKIYRTNDISRFYQVCILANSIGVINDDIIEDSNLELMTIHQSKGKEFDIVFIPFLNDRRFPSPHKTSLFETPFDIKKKDYLEEEKRLFFVALSRAKESLYLSYVKKFSENKNISKKSNLVELVEDTLNRKYYDKKPNYFDLTPSEKVKVEVFERIKKSIISNHFDLAKKDIELLEQIFEKNNSLKNYINEKHPDYDKYKQKILDSEKEPVDFDAKSNVYSVSQIQTYETCPRKYLYQYVYKVPSISKHYFDFGTSMHKVFELLVDDFDDNNLSDDELYIKGSNLIQKYWISEGYESAEQEKEYYELSFDILRSFIERERELRKNKREIVQKEQKFDIEIEGKKLMGFIDRIDQTSSGYEVIDYKTSNSMETEKNLVNNLQLYVYGEAVKTMRSAYPDKVSLWYLKQNEIRSISFKEINYDLLKTKLVENIREIERKNFKAKPSFMACKFCDFNKICPKAKR